MHTLFLYLFVPSSTVHLIQPSSISPHAADEIDKIISNKSKHSGDASAEGVQRDLLPLIEGNLLARSFSAPNGFNFMPCPPASTGTTVDVRKYGSVKTDHMLFVCSGAFHEHKPSDLLAELQVR